MNEIPHQLCSLKIAALEVLYRMEEAFKKSSLKNFGFVRDCRCSKEVFMLKFVCAFAAVAACFTLSAEEVDGAEVPEATVAIGDAADEVDGTLVQNLYSKGCGCGEKPPKK